MAYGRPVVAPREGGICEIVGDAGTFADDLTPEGLADALEPYLRDRARAAEVGARGRRRVEERFTLGHTVDGLARVYRRLSGVTPRDGASAATR
jgi:mannosyltransferase